MRTLLLLLSVSAAASAGLTAQDVPTYATDEDVAVAGTAAVPLGAPRHDSAQIAAVQGDRLIALGGSYGLPSGIDRHAIVAAFDAGGTAAWTWINEHDDESPTAIFAPPAGTGAFAALVDFDDRFAIVRIDDGLETWRVEMDGLTSSPYPAAELAGSADGARLFALVEIGFPADVVAALDPDTGAPLWTRQLPAGTYPLAVATDAAGAIVYVLLEGDTPLINDRVNAYDGATGALLWGAGLPGLVGDADPVSLHAAADGSMVVVGFRPDPGEANVVALAPDGSTLWTRAVPGTVHVLDMSPLGPEVIAIARNPDAFGVPQSLTVHALRLQNGATKWSFQLPAPSAAGDRIAAYVDAPGQRLALFFDSSPGSLLQPKEGTLTLLDLTDDGAPFFEKTQPLPASGFLRVGGVGVVPSAGGSRVLRWSSATPAGQDDEDFEVAVFDADGAPAGSTVIGIEAAVPEGLGLAVPPEGPAAFALLRRPGLLRVVAAVDRNDAALLWQVELSEDALGSSFLGPGHPIAATDDGALVVASRVGSFTFEPVALDGLDGATGAHLWSEPYPGYGNVTDLVVAEPAGAGGAVLFVAHGHDGAATTAETAMRAVDPATGTTLWVEPWPAGGFDAWWAATLAVDEPAGRVYGLVAAQIPSDELRVLARDTATGTLLASSTLHDADFAPGTELGVPLPSDVELSPDGATLYVLGRYHGTLSTPAHLAIAALDTATLSVLWGRAIDPSPGPLGGPAELVLASDGATLAVVTPADAAPGAARAAAITLDPQSGATLWQRSFGATGDPRTYLDAEPGADARTLAIALGRDDGVGEVVTLDLATGTVLHAVTADTPSSGDRVRALASAGGATFALIDATTTVPGGAATVARLEPEALVSGPDQTSLAAPETAVFLLDRPQSSAGNLYLVAGSATGTAPGIPFGGVVVPLVLDPYLLATLNHASQPPFVDTFGVLDAAGDARAALVVPSGLDPALIGVTLHHAFVEMTPGFAAVFASEAVTLGLVD